MSRLSPGFEEWRSGRRSKEQMKSFKNGPELLRDVPGVVEMSSESEYLKSTPAMTNPNEAIFDDLLRSERDYKIPPLPPLSLGWTAHWNSTANRYYFGELSTGALQWGAPSLSGGRMDHSGSEYEGKKSSAQEEEKPIDPGLLLLCPDCHIGFAFCKELSHHLDKYHFGDQQVRLAKDNISEIPNQYKPLAAIGIENYNRMRKERERLKAHRDRGLSNFEHSESDGDFAPAAPRVIGQTDSGKSTLIRNIRQDPRTKEQRKSDRFKRRRNAEVGIKDWTSRLEDRRENSDTDDGIVPVAHGTLSNRSSSTSLSDLDSDGPDVTDTSTNAIKRYGITKSGRRIPIPEWEDPDDPDKGLNFKYHAESDVRSKRLANSEYFDLPMFKDDRTQSSEKAKPPSAPNYLGGLKSRFPEMSLYDFCSARSPCHKQPGYAFICSTISKDNTPGEDARKSDLLAGFGKRLQRTAFEAKEILDLKQGLAAGCDDEEAPPAQESKPRGPRLGYFNTASSAKNPSAFSSRIWHPTRWEVKRAGAFSSHGGSIGRRNGRDQDERVRALAVIDVSQPTTTT